MTRTLNIRCVAILMTVLLMLSACGGGGSSGGGGSPPPTAIRTHTIGGTVTGLLGTGLILANGGQELAIGADGSFVFGAPLPEQAAYNVTVSEQPIKPWQTCAVGSAAGTVGTADVIDIVVTCTTNNYTVGGTASGVAGGVLVLRNNGGDDLTVNGSASQNFVFGTPVASGGRYEVTLASAPPSQICTLTNVAGQVESEDITSVSVSCSTITYTIGGTVSGLLPQGPLSSGLVLRKNANDPLTLSNSGPFTFAEPVASGGSYVVTVAVQPSSPAHTCFVTPQSAHGGPVTGDITTVDVQCAAAATSGSLDPGFGSNGIVLVDFEFALGSDTQPAALIQPADAKILIAGTTDFLASKDFGLFRLNTDGTLDTGFNGGANNGFVRTDISPSASSSIDHARAIARQSDGRIVLAGFTAAWDFALARYEANGVIDTTFGSNGVVITNINTVEYAHAMAIQSDDKIVVVGYTHQQGTGENFAIVRYTNTGAPDPSFNGGDPANTTGTVLTDFNSHDRANAVAIQANGKIVVAGQANGSSSDFALARYNNDGSLDTGSFGGGTGKVTTHLGSVDKAQALVIQPTGEIVLAGFSGIGLTTNFALVRYTANGVLDTTFDSDGIVITDIGGNRDEIHGVTLDVGGNIVVAGSSYNGINDDFALARYSSSGALDPTFGNGGIVIAPLGGGNDVAYSVIIQPDGKIVAVGQAENGLNAGGNVNIDFAAIRVSP